MEVGAAGGYNDSRHLLHCDGTLFRGSIARKLSKKLGTLGLPVNENSRSLRLQDSAAEIALDRPHDTLTPEWKRFSMSHSTPTTPGSSSLRPLRGIRSIWSSITGEGTAKRE